MELLPQDIHLIETENGTTLFFHAETLQIYPLQEGNELLQFLRALQLNGADGARELYNAEDFAAMYNYICEKIAATPLSPRKVSDTTQPTFNQIVLPIAGHCNLNCPYCFAQTDGGFHFRDYTEKDIVNVIDFLIAKNPDSNVPITIVFFGGEPLLRLDIIKFTTQYIKEHYSDRLFRYSMTTNGTIVNEEVIRMIRENHIAVMLSIDGPDNEFNLRTFRNQGKSIGKVINNIQMLKEQGIKMELRATLVNTNPYIEDTFRFFEEMKVPFDIVFAYQSENKTHQYADYGADTLSRIREQLDRVLCYYKTKIQNRENIYNKMFKTLSDILRYRKRRNVICGTGWNFFTITADGTIFPCAHLMNNPRYGIGNIHTNSFDKARWQELLPVAIEDIDECRDCWAKNLCMGGCVSEKISIGRKNNQALEEKECQLQQLIWEFNIKLYYLFMSIAPEYFIKDTVKEQK